MKNTYEDFVSSLLFSIPGFSVFLAIYKFVLLQYESDCFAKHTNKLGIKLVFDICMQYYLLLRDQLNEMTRFFNGFRIH